MLQEIQMTFEIHVAVTAQSITVARDSNRFRNSCGYIVFEKHVAVAALQPLSDLSSSRRVLNLINNFIINCVGVACMAYRISVQP